MKALFIIITLLLLSFAGFSQSISFIELRDQLKNPDELPNQFITTQKHFKLLRSMEMGGRYITDYMVAPGTDKEERITTGLGWKQNDGTFKHTINYRTKDSLFLQSLVNQLKTMPDYKPIVSTPQKGVTTIAIEHDDYQVLANFYESKAYSLEISQKKGVK